MTSSVIIKKIVYDIRNSPIKDLTERRNHFRAKYMSFFSTHPTLFECALDKSFPLSFLDFMLDQRNKLSGTSDEETVKEADQKVYEVLQEKYFKDIKIVPPTDTDGSAPASALVPAPASAPAPQ